MQIVKRNFENMTSKKEDYIGHFQISYNSDGRITLRIEDMNNDGQDILVNLNISETQKLIEFLENVYIKSHLTRIHT